MERFEEHSESKQKEKDYFCGDIDIENVFIDSTNETHGEFVFPDLIKTEFEIRFETLHCNEYDKYLVPIFTEEKDSTLKGNGVIVGQYLITAAHVAMNDNGKNFRDGSIVDVLYYKFENKYFKLLKGKMVCGGSNFDYDRDEHRDLVVYKLDKAYNSFIFSDKDIELGMELISCQYDYQFGMLEQNRNISTVVSLVTKACEKARVEWNNCYRVESKNRFIHGNSGCALFQKNVLYGIFLRWYRYENDVREEMREYVVLNSKYIKEEIEKTKQ